MPALGVDPELCLVDRGKGEVARQSVAGVALVIALRTGDRHALGGAQHIACLGRHDPLLAGQQRDRRGPLDRDHPVVHLARQKPQREADYPARMGTHSLDREIGLAGVGGPENSPYDPVTLAAHALECGTKTTKCKPLLGR